MMGSDSEHYLLEHPEEKYDPIPEVYLGKNVADFIDPDIMEVGTSKQWIVSHCDEEIINLET